MSLKDVKKCLDIKLNAYESLFEEQKDIVIGRLIYYGEEYKKSTNISDSIR